MGLDTAPSRIERRRVRDVRCEVGEADVIRFTGDLVGDAHIRYQAGTEPGCDNRRAWLVCRLIIPGGLFVDVSQAVGTTASDHMAADLRTRYLRHGTRATVWAKGAMTVDKQGTTVLVLLLPQIFVDTVAPRTDPLPVVAMRDTVAAIEGS
jgi:hypothetical protein